MNRTTEGDRHALIIAVLLAVVALSVTALRMNYDAERMDTRIDRLEQEQKDAPISHCVVPEDHPEVRICKAAP
jgi:hypothetical protein